jgi:predicted DNA-binding transcriptional regulator YafY
VTERTVRRDITRLRDLGYPVVGASGPQGGYTLGRAGRMPPLVLDDDEAVAVAVALRAAAGAPGAGPAAPASLSALAKLDQVLPGALRERVAALAGSADALTSGRGALPDVEVLLGVALAVQRTERLRFTYTDHQGRTSSRLVEPYRLVFTDRHWYLVALDVDRAGWRTFRVDRVAELARSGARFTPVPDPPDAVALVARGVAVDAFEVQARLVLHVPPEEASRLLAPGTAVLSPGPDGTTLADVGGDAPFLARFVAGLDCEVDVLEPEEVRAELRRLGRRLAARHAAAAAPAGPAATG